MPRENRRAALGDFPAALERPKRVVEADFGEQVLGAEEDFPVGLLA